MGRGETGDLEYDHHHLHVVVVVVVVVASLRPQRSAECLPLRKLLHRVSSLESARAII